MNESEREREQRCCRPTSALVLSHPLIEGLSAFPRLLSCISSLGAGNALVLLSLI